MLEVADQCLVVDLEVSHGEAGRSLKCLDKLIIVDDLFSLEREELALKSHDYGVLSTSISLVKLIAQTL